MKYLFPFFVWLLTQILVQIIFRGTWPLLLFVSMIQGGIVGWYWTRMMDWAEDNLTNSKN